jgi:hypothetical protein
MYHRYQKDSQFPFWEQLMYGPWQVAKYQERQQLAVSAIL